MAAADDHAPTDLAPADLASARAAALPDLGAQLVCASSLVRRHGSSATAHEPADPWPPPGHVLELTGDFTAAATSAAVVAVADVQRADGIVAWVQMRGGALFPPDLAANGVDLDALAVVRLPAMRAPGPADRMRRGESAAGHSLPQAAELLLRSGAFDLVVLDLRPAPPPRGAWLGRLQALAREHGTRVLLLTDASAPIGFATGLAQRLEPRRRRDGSHFVIEPVLQRDKLHAGGLPQWRSRSGPTGLC
jgi:hypothetical protein